jgi:hypothetical protein
MISYDKIFINKIDRKYFIRDIFDQENYKPLS